MDIVAGPARGTGRLTPPCPDERRVATPTVHQTRAVLATCAEEGQQSSWGGTMLLRWSQRSTLVEVGVYGAYLIVSPTGHFGWIAPASRMADMECFAARRIRH